MCLPAVSGSAATVFGMICAPSSVIRRGAEPPAPLVTVSVGSRRRGSVRSGVSVCDWRILPSTTCGTYTATPLRWFFVSALVSVTFGAGAAGAGVTMLAIFTVSALAPLIELERVAGGAAGQAREPDRRVAVGGRSARARVGCSVVGAVPQIATGPLVSISSAIVL